MERHLAKRDITLQQRLLCQTYGGPYSQYAGQQVSNLPPLPLSSGLSSKASDTPYADHRLSRGGIYQLDSEGRPVVVVPFR
jgi:hypothetical protein